VGLVGLGGFSPVKAETNLRAGKLPPPHLRHRPDPDPREVFGSPPSLVAEPTEKRI
jgi:hypothetical protein